MTKSIKLKRRDVLGLVAGAGAGIAVPRTAWSQGAPAIRRKVNLKYWHWSDNAEHQQRLNILVEHFNKSQDFITVALDASMRAVEISQKVAVAFAAGGAPDVAGMVAPSTQNFYNAGILEPVDPFFQQWDQKSDFYPNIVEAMRAKPGQPVLYLAYAMLAFVLYYRADWFEEAKLSPPKNYDDFIAAAKAISAPPNRYGYALRGADYLGTQPLEPIWASAGVQFVKPDNTVDFDSAAAMKVTDAWVGLLTRDNAAQPTAVTDSYPQLFSLVSSGKCGMWIYGTHGLPELRKSLGDKIQAVAVPSAGTRNYQLFNGNGNFIVSSTKEKEAAWELVKFMASEEASISLGPERGFMPVRASLSKHPLVRGSAAMEIVTQNSANLWSPPFFSENWINYQDGIAPYWQQMLRKQISVADYHAQAAALLRGSKR